MGLALVFSNSSHGTDVAEKGGDEPLYDEAICPYDIGANLPVDDELREQFAGLPKGVRLTVISDSCFSGMVTRAPAAQIIPGLKVLNNPWTAEPKRAKGYPQAKICEVLLSGCTDQEYSYDATIGGTRSWRVRRRTRSGRYSVEGLGGRRFPPIHMLQPICLDRIGWSDWVVQHCLARVPSARVACYLPSSWWASWPNLTA